MNTDITIRLANADDAEALLNIYAPYVEATPITFEYTVPSVEEFRSRIISIQEKYPYLVAEIDHRIVGYTYASVFKGRAAYDWSVETSIYVDVEWRGCGIGHALYQVLEKWLARQNIVNLNACITHPNPSSVRFHRSFGYRTVAHFSKSGYKLGAWHDVIWMEKKLGKHRNPPEPVRWLSDILSEERESEKTALEWKKQQTEKERRRKLAGIRMPENEPETEEELAEDLTVESGTETTADRAVGSGAATTEDLTEGSRPETAEGSEAVPTADRAEESKAVPTADRAEESKAVPENGSEAAESSSEKAGKPDEADKAGKPGMIDSADSEGAGAGGNGSSGGADAGGDGTGTESGGKAGADDEDAADMPGEEAGADSDPDLQKDPA